MKIVTAASVLTLALVATQAKADCSALPPLAAGASEIFVEDLNSNAFSQYRLVLAEEHVANYSFSSINAQAMVSVAASAGARDFKPDHRVSLECKDIGSSFVTLKGSLVAPQAISAVDQSLGGTLKLDYSIMQDSPYRKDILSDSVADAPPAVSLNALKISAASAGDVHLYQISANQFELRVKQENGSRSYSGAFSNGTIVTTRYVFQGTN